MCSSKWLVFIRSLLAGFDRSLTKLGIWLVLVARSYRKLNEKTLETPMKSADNWPVGKRKEAGHYFSHYYFRKTVALRQGMGNRLFWAKFPGKNG